MYGVIFKAWGCVGHEKFHYDDEFLGGQCLSEGGANSGESWLLTVLMTPEHQM